MTWFLLFIRRSWVHLFVHCNPNGKCPACGNKRGEIRWIPEFTFDEKERPTTGAILHRCAICTAMWGERALIEKKYWNVSVDPADWNRPIGERAHLERPG